MAADEQRTEPAEPRPAATDGSQDSEDLFGFDELRGAPAADASARAAAGDDLFDFDELVPEPDLAGTPDLDELLSDPTSHEPSAGGAAVPADAAPVPAPAGSQSARVAAPPARAESPARTASLERRAAPAEAESAPAPAPRRATLVALAVLVLLNLGLIGFVWRTNAAVHESVASATQYMIEATDDIQRETSQRIAIMEGIGKPVVAPDTTKVETFERVEEDLAQGDYASARRRLHALLAVADRIDDAVREDVEARAHYLLADTLRLQARAAPEAQP